MAVYTNVTSEELSVFLRGYDLGEYRSHEGISQGVSNSNFHVFTDKGRFILTLFEERRVNYDDLPFFFAFAAHLRERGIACPRALPDREGREINELAGRAAVILNFLEGKDIKPIDLTYEHCAQVGTLVANMHVASLDFDGQRENSMGVAQWGKLVAKAESYAEKFEPGLYGELVRELDYLTACWPQGLPQGTVHADIFPDNVFFQEGKLAAIIDFYFSCTDFYAYDLALTVNAWCFGEGEMFAIDRFLSLMRSYQATRPLGDDERSALQILHRGAAFRILLSRLEEYFEYDPASSFVIPHDPGEYLKRWRYHQEHDVADFL